MKPCEEAQKEAKTGFQCRYQLQGRDNLVWTMDLVSSDSQVLLVI